MQKDALKKMLGFMPKLKKPRKTKKLSKIPAEAINHVFQGDELDRMEIDSRLDVNIDTLRIIMADSSDFVIRKFAIGPDGNAEAAVAYLDGMTDTDMVHKAILKPLMKNKETAASGRDGSVPFEHVAACLLTAGDVRAAVNYKQVFSGMLYGDAVLLLGGHKKALIISIKGFNVRSIQEPITEGLVRGPREGFTENLRTNTAMVRRRVQSPNFVLQQMTIGRVSNTNVAIAYIRGLADPKLVEEVEKRLNRIEIDGVLESGYIEELIEDEPLSPFPQINHTERPDRVAEAVMSGRVAIFTDNTPFVLIAPAEFMSFMQSPEDYYERYLIGTFVRILRYVALVASLVLPSLYIAITTFHQEMIPTPLLIRIAASREGVPFPALVEAMLMEVSFELLREAGLRLPRPVGQAVSIVGALVVGEAAVTAGIVSPLMVIIVAVTGIASFVNPAFNIAITMRILRFPMMILAGTLGLFGIMAGFLVILVHMCSLRSFGVPYMAPFAPYHSSGMRDVFVRVPWWAMQRRPHELAKNNPFRVSKDMMPGPWQNKQDEKRNADGSAGNKQKSSWEAERRRKPEIMQMKSNQREGEQSGGEQQQNQTWEADESGEKQNTQRKKRRTRRTHKKK